MSNHTNNQSWKEWIHVHKGLVAATAVGATVVVVSAATAVALNLQAPKSAQTKPQVTSSVTAPKHDKNKTDEDKNTDANTESNNSNMDQNVSNNNDTASNTEVQTPAVQDNTPAPAPVTPAPAAVAPQTVVPSAPVYHVSAPQSAPAPQPVAEPTHVSAPVHTLDGPVGPQPRPVTPEHVETRPTTPKWVALAPEPHEDVQTPASESNTDHTTQHRDESHENAATPSHEEAATPARDDSTTEDHDSHDTVPVETTTEATDSTDADSTTTEEHHEDSHEDSTSDTSEATSTPAPQPQVKTPAQFIDYMNNAEVEHLAQNGQSVNIEWIPNDITARERTAQTGVIPTQIDTWGLFACDAHDTHCTNFLAKGQTAIDQYKRNAEGMTSYDVIDIIKKVPRGITPYEGEGHWKVY